MNYKDSFSGSKFQLFERNQNIYIKKFYKNINNRDLKSFEKQRDFKNYYIKKYRVQSAKIDKIDLVFLISCKIDLICSIKKIAVMFNFIPSLESFLITFKVDLPFVKTIGTFT